MIKRTVEISQNPAHLSVRLDQLLIQPHDEPDPSKTASIPCEDLGVVVVDHTRCTYSHHALTSIAEHGGVLVVCGRDHLPAAVLLPLADHHQVVWRIADQIAISKPLQKQLWQQLIRAKIIAQASNLDDKCPAHGRLVEMVKEVRSGDPTNVEAQAAKLYWRNWTPGDEQFRRDPSSSDPLNAMLNYGYSVLRASVARALVGAGLQPALGIHHCNRSNAFCLADDLVEPLRPIVDRRVKGLYVDHNRRELNQPTKAGILQILGDLAACGPEQGPLFVGIQRMVASLVKCFQGESKDMVIPRMAEQG